MCKAFGCALLGVMCLLLTSCIIPHVAMVLPTLNCMLSVFHALWYCNVLGKMVLYKQVCMCSSTSITLIHGPLTNKGLLSDRHMCCARPSSAGNISLHLTSELVG